MLQTNKVAQNRRDLFLTRYVIQSRENDKIKSER
jgi:hypothetical protein